MSGPEDGLNAVLFTDRFAHSGDRMRGLADANLSVAHAHPRG